MRSSIQVCEWYISGFYPGKNCPSLTSWHFFLRCSRAMYLTWWGFLDGLRPLGSCLLFFFVNESYIDWLDKCSHFWAPQFWRDMIYHMSYILEDFPNCHAIHFSGKSERVRKEPSTRTGGAINEAYLDFVARPYSTGWWWVCGRLIPSEPLQPIARQCASSMRSLLLVFPWSSAGSIDLMLILYGCSAGCSEESRCSPIPEINIDYWLLREKEVSNYVHLIFIHIYIYIINKIRIVSQKGSHHLKKLYKPMAHWSMHH